MVSQLGKCLSWTLKVLTVIGEKQNEQCSGQNNVIEEVWEMNSGKFWLDFITTCLTLGKLLQLPESQLLPLYIELSEFNVLMYNVLMY